MVPTMKEHQAAFNTVYREYYKIPLKDVTLAHVVQITQVISMNLFMAGRSGDSYMGALDKAGPTRENFEYTPNSRVHDGFGESLDDGGFNAASVYEFRDYAFAYERVGDNFVSPGRVSVHSSPMVRLMERLKSKSLSTDLQVGTGKVTTVNLMDQLTPQVGINAKFVKDIPGTLKSLMPVKAGGSASGYTAREELESLYLVALACHIQEIVSQSQQTLSQIFEKYMGQTMASITPGFLYGGQVGYQNGNPMFYILFPGRAEWEYNGQNGVMRNVSGRGAFSNGPDMGYWFERSRNALLASPVEFKGAVQSDRSVRMEMKLNVHAPNF